MGRTREQVHGGGPGEPIALLRQQLYIPAQGGRVAGDIDDALRPHPGYGVDDLRGQALSGRVHADHIRVQLLRRQLGGDVSGVAAEKLRILYAVGRRILPGVFHRRRDDLRTDDLFCLVRHGQGDGPGAAVKIQHQLRARKAGVVHRPAVQHLRLVPIHLVKGGNRQPEGMPAEGVREGVPAPKRPVSVP